MCVSVREQTIKREELIIRRLGEIIGDDYLLTKITPKLFISTKTHIWKYYSKDAKRYVKTLSKFSMSKYSRNESRSGGVSPNMELTIFLGACSVPNDKKQ